jgi:hypothetical protein
MRECQGDRNRVLASENWASKGEARKSEGARMGKVVRRDEKQKRSAEQRYGLGRQTRPTNSISSSTTTTSSAVQHQGAAGMRPDPNLNANPSGSKHSHSPRAMAAKLEGPRPATGNQQPAATSRCSSSGRWAQRPGGSAQGVRLGGGRAQAGGALLFLRSPCRWPLGPPHVLQAW